MTREHTAARLPDATATALAAHLLGDAITSTPDLHEAAAAQVGDVIVVEAVYAIGYDWGAVRFEVNQAGDFTSTFDPDALRLIPVAEYEAEPVCPTCGGSGGGVCPESTCPVCRGRGHVGRRGRPEPDDDRYGRWV